MEICKIYTRYLILSIFKKIKITSLIIFCMDYVLKQQYVGLERWFSS